VYSRSNHTDKGKLAKRVKMSLKITSRVNGNTHPRSDTAMHLINGHQLMNSIGNGCSRDDDGGQKSITLHIGRLAGVWPKF
jgi:hypothetical protein